MASRSSVSASRHRPASNNSWARSTCCSASIQSLMDAAAGASGRWQGVPAAISLSGLPALINGHRWADFPTLGPVASSGTYRRDLLALGALCAVTFFLGLTTHGLTNWREAQRALVARGVARRGDWLVRTVNGEPYLAKPPLIYWAQLGLARLRGSQPTELDLRLTVALAASLGVLATYWAGRRILRSALPPGADPEAAPGAARAGAFWAAAMLGTGILYV